MLNLILASIVVSALPQAEPPAELKAFDGEWIWQEDRTPGRAPEQFNPPLSSRFSLRAEADAMILVSGHGSGHTNVRITFDGRMTEVPNTNPGSFARYRGSWKDGTFTYEVDFIREAGGTPQNLIRRAFTLTPDGLIVRSNLMDETVGLYKQAKDVPLPATAKATINDLSWMQGNWSGIRGTENQIYFEELWSPPRGGSMFATARTVNRDRLSAFEYLRILERDGSLVYIAQPGGAAPTEFYLTEFTASRAVFQNPRHDYPKQIIYERTGDSLTATIGYIVGGSPRRFEFKLQGATGTNP